MPELQPNHNKTLATLILTVFIDLLGVTLVIPIVAPLFLDLQNGVMPFSTAGIAPAQIGAAIKDALHERTLVYAFLVASFPLAQFIGAPYLGALADKYGRKKILLLSLIGTLLGYIVFAIGIKYKLLWMLFAGRIIDGFTGGNIAIVFSSVADISTPQTKTKNFGLVGAAFGVGFIIGPYIGGKLADSSLVSWFSFATPYWTAAILCAINIAMVIYLFIDTRRPDATKRLNIWQGFINVKNAFVQANTRVIFTVVFFLTLGFTMFTTFFQVFLIDKFQFTQSNVGDYFAYIGLFIAFTQGFLSRKLSHIVPEKIFSIVCLGLSAALVIVTLPNAMWLLYVVSPLIALNQGLVGPNIQTMVSNSAPEDRQGEISGINQSVQSLGQAIPPILAAYLVQYGKAFALYGAATFVLLAWLCFVFFYKKK